MMKFVYGTISLALFTMGAYEAAGGYAEASLAWGLLSACFLALALGEVVDARRRKKQGQWE